MRLQFSCTYFPVNFLIPVDEMSKILQDYLLPHQRSWTDDPLVFLQGSFGVSPNCSISCCLIDVCWCYVWKVMDSCQWIAFDCGSPASSQYLLRVLREIDGEDTLPADYVSLTGRPSNKLWNSNTQLNHSCITLILGNKYNLATRLTVTDLFQMNMH